MRRKIDVTPDEMLELRERGYSNHDIAKSLDVSMETVRRYIGKQNGRMEGLAAFKDTPPRKKMETKTEVNPMIPKYEPKPVLEKFVVGDFGIELDNTGRLLTLSSDAGDIVFEYESTPNIVQFLAWAMRERMEVTADAEADKVRKQEGESERREV